MPINLAIEWTEIVSDVPRDLLPLTRGQSGIWFGQQPDGYGAAYNSAAYLDIDGPIDAALFEEVIHRCLRESDAFRANLEGTAHLQALLVDAGHVPGQPAGTLDALSAR